MSTLYIIGNGFDVAHGLKTSYWYFMEYLKRYADDFYYSIEKSYGFTPYYPERISSPRAEALFIIRRTEEVFKGFWSNIEHNLGCAEEQDMLDFSSSVLEDLDLESGPVGIEDTMNQYWEKEYRFIRQLNDYLYKWARQIRLFHAKPLASRLVNNDCDYFLSFNYTNTLERIYHISSDRILHIHGGLSPYCDNRPVIGHGNKDVIQHYREEARLADERFDEGSKSINNAIATFYERTYKRTDLYMLDLNFFIVDCDNIDTIEIIGHSLADIDLPYFNHIHEIIGDNANWIVYYHNNEEIEQMRNAILNTGVDEAHLETKPSDDFWE